MMRLALIFMFKLKNHLRVVFNRRVSFCPQLLMNKRKPAPEIGGRRPENLVQDYCTGGFKTTVYVPPRRAFKVVR